jgi:carotenoid 1,2-hydratase
MGEEHISTTRSVPTAGSAPAEARSDDREPPSPAVRSLESHPPGQRPYGVGYAGPPSRGASTAEPRFDRPVEPDGYSWWYVDALSDDGKHGLTLIAMIGSVFSPYYAWARRRGPANPEDFCALNVALYGNGGKRWALTERGASALDRSVDHLAIGPSSVSWNGRWLEVNVDEITAPLPTRLRGQIRVHPSALTPQSFAIDSAARHCWWPVAPCSRIEVEMQRPGLCWGGDAYFDSNWGSEPLERRFVGWDWSRSTLADGSCAILYDKVIRGEPARSLALRFDCDGNASAFPPPPRVSLATTPVWRVARGAQVEAGHHARVVKTLEDTPFYARSVISSHLLGQPVTSMHESLSLDRFSQRWVQLLLPFRTPRIKRAYRR